YQQSPTGRSELVSVTLCGSGNVCLPATSFTWQGQYGFPGTTGFNRGWGGMLIVTADFDGDGKTDFFVCPTSSGALCVVYYSTGSDLVQSPWTAQGGGWSVLAADFNGDGKADLLACPPTSGFCVLFNSTGRNFSNSGI